MSAADLHPQVPEIDEIVPVLYVRGRDDQLLLLPCLLTIVGVPEEPHHSLEGHTDIRLPCVKLRKITFMLIIKKKALKTCKTFWKLTIRDKQL